MHVSAPCASITSEMTVLGLSAIGMISASHRTRACKGFSSFALMLGKVFFPARGRRGHSIISLIAASP